MHWNGHGSGYNAHKNSGKEDIEIDKNSFHTFSGSFKHNGILKKSLPTKINIPKGIDVNLADWTNGRPPQKEAKGESAYIELDLGYVGKKTSKMLEASIKKIDLTSF